MLYHSFRILRLIDSVLSIGDHRFNHINMLCYRSQILTYQYHQLEGISCHDQATHSQVTNNGHPIRRGSGRAREASSTPLMIHALSS